MSYIVLYISLLIIIINEVIFIVILERTINWDKTDTLKPIVIPSNQFMKMVTLEC